MTTGAAFDHANSILNQVLDNPRSVGEMQARIDAAILMGQIISGHHPVRKQLASDQVDDFSLYVGLCVYDSNKGGCLLPTENM